MKHYFQKYGIACMIGLVIFVLILPVQVFAAGEDSSSENNRTEDNMTNTGGNGAENLGSDRGKGSGYGNPETVPGRKTAFSGSC